MDELERRRAEDEEAAAGPRPLPRPSAPAPSARDRACASRRASVEIGGLAIHEPARSPSRSSPPFSTRASPRHSGQQSRRGSASSRRSRAPAFPHSTWGSTISASTVRARALGRRGAAHPPRDPDRLEAHGGALHPRRAVHRTASPDNARLLEGLVASARDGEQRDRRRARRGDDPGSRSTSSTWAPVRGCPRRRDRRLVARLEDLLRDPELAHGRLSLAAPPHRDSAARRASAPRAAREPRASTAAASTTSRTSAFELPDRTLSPW